MAFGLLKRGAKFAGKMAVKEITNKIPGGEIVKTVVQRAAPGIIPKTDNLPNELVNDLARFRDKWALLIAQNPMEFTELISAMFAKIMGQEKTPED